MKNIWYIHFHGKGVSGNIIVPAQSSSTNTDRMNIRLETNSNKLPKIPTYNMFKYNSNTPKISVKTSAKNKTPYLAKLNMAFPKYDYAQELAMPIELQIGRGGGFDQIGNAVAGVNYYFDAIGFGEATGFARTWGNRQFRNKQRPLGVQFFTDTGRKCSNGEPMYEYISTIPQGNLLGKRMKDEIQKIGLPPLKGLGTGILEDARDALNPNAFSDAWNRGEESSCKKHRARVGDSQGKLASEKDPSQIWITGPTQRDAQGFPTQEFWIRDVKEGFTVHTDSVKKPVQQIYFAGILLGLVGVAMFLSHKAK